MLAALLYLQLINSLNSGWLKLTFSVLGDSIAVLLVTQSLCGQSLWLMNPIQTIYTLCTVWWGYELLCTQLNSHPSSVSLHFVLVTCHCDHVTFCLQPSSASSAPLALNARSYSFLSSCPQSILILPIISHSLGRYWIFGQPMVPYHSASMLHFQI